VEQHRSGRAVSRPDNDHDDSLSSGADADDSAGDVDDAQV
jgi:hypothetical protein